jgi:hypothetical protein
VNEDIKILFVPLVDELEEKAGAEDGKQRDDAVEDAGAFDVVRVAVALSRNELVALVLSPEDFHVPKLLPFGGITLIIGCHLIDEGDI